MDSRLRSFVKFWRNMGCFPRLLGDLACELEYIVLKRDIFYWKLQSQKKNLLETCCKMFEVSSGKGLSGKWSATFSFHTYHTFKLHGTKWKMIACVEDILWTWWLHKPWIIAQFYVSNGLVYIVVGQDLKFFLPN